MGDSACLLVPCSDKTSFIQRRWRGNLQFMNLLFRCVLYDVTSGAIRPKEYLGISDVCNSCGLLSAFYMFWKVRDSVLYLFFSSSKTLSLRSLSSSSSLSLSSSSSLSQYRLNKLTSVFYASVLKLMISCVLTSSKWLWKSRAAGEWLPQQTHKKLTSNCFFFVVVVVFFFQ